MCWWAQDLSSRRVCAMPKSNFTNAAAGETEGNEGGREGKTDHFTQEHEMRENKGTPNWTSMLITNIVGFCVY